MIKVLVFPCGTEVGLEINKSLANSKHFELYGCSSIDDHGAFEYKNYLPNIPYISEENFIAFLNKLILDYKIDLVIPAHDSAVLKMSKHKAQISAMVICSTFETCEICRSKLLTYNFFENIILTPKVYGDINTVKFPVFLKPEVGQGSKGTHLVGNIYELEFYLKKDPTLLILEYLPGKEYTIDCFTNYKGELLFSEGRERVRTNNGISVNSVSINLEIFRIIALKINTHLNLRGAWFFQLKENINNELVLLEIAPRIAGTMCLYRNTGVNFIELSLYDFMNYNVRILKNSFKIEIDRALSNKFKINIFYKTIYIDFDDTIIINNKVNVQIISFLYQSKNEKKEIILITKHKNNIYDSLLNYSISYKIFDKIILLGDNDNKSKFIKKDKSIFIDDSFKERYEVFETLRIPVFSLDSIESLLTSKF